MRLLILLCLLGTAPLSTADTVLQQGFEIHYTTFTSDLIPATVAAAHNIVRSKNRIVTNITILKDNEPTKAHVSGHNMNLLGQLFTMEFTEVIEPGAVYYLSNQLISEKDMLRFELEILPTGAQTPITLKFERRY